MPDSSDPPPRQAEEHDENRTVTELGFDEYHELADAYFERLLQKLEEKQEETSHFDAEYSVRRSTQNEDGSLLTYFLGWCTPHRYQGQRYDSDQQATAK
jgi:frataxin